jgi:acetylornithine deacetylase/succinyl-diaminopimelate desuccinylase-like protein
LDKAEGIVHIEGPDRYSPKDVADAFADLLRRKVQVEEIPRESWTAAFEQAGFSPSAAESYACMTAAVVDEIEQTPTEMMRGGATLHGYLSAHLAET